MSDSINTILSIQDTRQNLKCVIFIVLAEVYDRRDKPSVLVTSPGSPDLLSTTRASTHTGRYANHLTPGGPLAIEPSQSVGGRIQIKLGYEPNGLQLIVTIIGATGLIPRQNGAGRNAYVKVQRK